MKKKKLNPEQEALFFYWLGYRLFTTALRGHVMGHRRPLSAARDYLRVQSVDEGIERDACEFLVDIAKMVGQGPRDKLSLEELFEKWSESAQWRPELNRQNANEAPPAPGRDP